MVGTPVAPSSSRAAGIEPSDRRAPARRTVRPPPRPVARALNWIRPYQVAPCVDASGAHVTPGAGADRHAASTLPKGMLSAVAGTPNTCWSVRRACCASARGPRATTASAATAASITRRERRTARPYAAPPRPVKRGALDGRLHPVALPLEGIVVADLTQNVAGPFCTQILGDMGAEVIKVERPGRGDDARAWAPPYWGQESATFIALNRNKKSLALDLKSPGGLEILQRLVRRADVFVQSLRPGAIDELGLDFAGASRINPRIVYCSVTAFGARGPLSHLPGYDPLMQAYSGLMSVNGHPGQEPARVGTSVVDMGTGMWAALGIVAALRERDMTGRAMEVTTSLFETALMWVSYHAMGYLGSGDVPQPQGSGTAMIAPYQAFPTADGYVMIGAASDALFQRLTVALDAPDLGRDARFVDNPSRVRNRATLAAAVAARTRGHTSAD